MKMNPKLFVSKKIVRMFKEKKIATHRQILSHLLMWNRCLDWFGGFGFIFVSV